MRQSVNHTTLTKHYFSGTQEAVALAPLPLERGWGEVITAQRTQPVGLYFLHGDHLGTATFVTNSSGEANQFFLNLPYGETMAEQTLREGYVNPYKFNAKELDSQTGLYYYGARYYNPRVSVWYSVDPLAEKMPAWSPYNYTFDNPIRFIDPTGMAPDDWYKDKDGNLKWFEGNGKQKGYERVAKAGSFRSYTEYNGKVEIVGMNALHSDGSATVDGKTYSNGEIAFTQGRHSIETKEKVVDNHISESVALTLDSHNLAMDGAAALSKDAGKFMKLATKTTGLAGVVVGGGLAMNDIIKNGANASNVTSLGLGVASAILLATPIGQGLEIMSVVIDAAIISKDVYDIIKEQRFSH